VSALGRTHRRAVAPPASAVTLGTCLFGPAQRPIQVTQDLRCFWERTLSEVKKELKAGYPPPSVADEPWERQATALGCQTRAGT